VNFKTGSGKKLSETNLEEAMPGNCHVAESRPIPNAKTKRFCREIRIFWEDLTPSQPVVSQNHSKENNLPETEAAFFRLVYDCFQRHP